MMRKLLMVVAAGLVVSGCANRKGSENGGNSGAAGTETPVIRNIQVISGKVALVNAGLRYVVVDFSVGSTPRVDQHLNVYRRGQKVAVVKISSQSRSSTVAADILEGQVEKGDEVRSD